MHPGHHEPGSCAGIRYVKWPFTFSGITEIVKFCASKLICGSGQVSWIYNEK